MASEAEKRGLEALDPRKATPGGDAIAPIGSTGAKFARDAEVTGAGAGFSRQMIRPLCVHVVLTAS